MKTGRTYFVNNELVPYWRWQEQMVLYVGSAFDSLEIKLILEKKVQRRNAILEDVQPFTQKMVLAHVSLNITDISYFFDQNVKKEVGMGILMDFEEDIEFR